MKATDRHKLIDRINTLEGLTDDERSALLGLLREHKTYGLVWEDKPEEMEERLRNELPVLVEVKDRALTDAGPYAPNHILIEGDNLEALTTLAYTHEGKIDVIYIDPPYNTGNKDFIYNDSYVDSEDGYRHSKWLSFMSRRLRIAKKLLSDRGVIFISIDDNELHNLISMCDSQDFFGEANRVGVMCRATGTTTGQDANKLGSSFDYCVIYSKSNFILKGVGLTEKDLKRFKDSDSRGAYSTLQLRKTGNADRREDRPNMFYPVMAPDDTEVYPFGPTNYLSRWRVSRKSFEELLRDDMIVWKESPVEHIEVDGYIRSKWTPYVKYYSEGRTKQISNLLQDIEGNKKASIVIKEIFGDKGVFEYPKPVEFIKILETIGSDKDSIVLNFFAGPSNTEFAAEFNFYNVHYMATHVAGNSGGNNDDLIEALDMMSKGKINPSAMVTHVGGLDCVVETTKNLPNIKGGKKLVYTHVSMPLTAIADFEKLGESDPMFAELDALVKKHNGLWNAEAEKYLLEHAKEI